MKKISTGLMLLTLLTSLLVTSISNASTYEDFGEKAGIVKLMDQFMIDLLANEKTKPHFINADQKRIKEKLVEQVCEALEGPCKYTGKTMAESHSGLDISKNEFNALVEVLRTSMSKQNIPVKAQNKLLAKMAPMHRDIIRK